MIFDNAENKCTLFVLRILEKKEVRYSVLFKETKFSHTTIQKVLRDLESKKLISKDETYKITDKGLKLLGKLEEVRKIIE